MSVESDCVTFVEALLARVNEGKVITFERDFGGNTMTILVKDHGHTHCGSPDGSFNSLVKIMRSYLNRDF